MPRVARTAETVVGVLILASVLAAIVLSAIDRSRIDDQARAGQVQTACQARYNAAVAATIAVRAQLNDADRRATATLIRGVFTVPAGLTLAQRQARVMGLYVTWSAAERQYENRLRATRFPSLAQRCGPQGSEPPGR